MNPYTLWFRCNCFWIEYEWNSTACFQHICSCCCFNKLRSLLQDTWTVDKWNGNAYMSLWESSTLNLKSTSSKISLSWCFLLLLFIFFFLFFNFSNIFLNFLRGWSHLMITSSVFFAARQNLFWEGLDNQLRSSILGLCLYGFVSVILLWKVTPWLGTLAYDIGLQSWYVPQGSVWWVWGCHQIQNLQKVQRCQTACVHCSACSATCDW